METIVIEAVTDKYANKYNSGSVKVDGKWLQVAKNLDLNDFKKDTQMTVETKTNDKGYTSIIGLVDSAKTERVKKAVAKAKEDGEKPKAVVTEDAPVAVKSYEDNKNRRILVQGITQSVAASPSLAGLPFTNSDEVVRNIKTVATELINFVDEMCK